MAGRQELKNTPARRAGRKKSRIEFFNLEGDLKMVCEISASWETLVEQASMTSETYFERAQVTLERSGLPFTASDVVALAAVSARDFHTSAVSVASQSLGERLDRIGRALEDAASAIGE